MKRTEVEPAALQRQIREREKELDGLYRLATLFSQSEYDAHTLLRDTAEVLRRSMEWPEEVSVALSAEDVMVSIGQTGEVRDSYRVVHPYGEDGRVEIDVSICGERAITVSPRERAFIDSTASLLADVLLRLETREALRSGTAELERKNIALREILHQIELEKRSAMENVKGYVEMFVLPHLRDLVRGGTLRREELLRVTQAENALKGLIAADPEHVVSSLRKLTPREVEIAGLVRNGMTTKEIGEYFHIAATTVERHRNNIRKKLGLAGGDMHLAVYLRSLH